MIVCEITAHSPDRMGHWLLATYGTSTPRLALRWLTARAGELADRLDPDPHEVTWADEGAFRLSAPDGLDPSEHLRLWQADLVAHEHMMQALAVGSPVVLTVHDDAALYTLTAYRTLADVWATFPYPAGTDHQVHV
ncbi:hypothetical protein [Streptomyces sp. NBC_01174]|uniref:hypothetical protein n=1 Tax=Streptomyces sp. NBC_01174 TaxID=2903758 RepID=UPI002F915ACA|nr:hypothetical protein OG414_41010 [Streptomyces sp. NBC_01174]